MVEKLHRCEPHIHELEGHRDLLMERPSTAVKHGEEKA